MSGLFPGIPGTLLELTYIRYPQPVPSTPSTSSSSFSTSSFSTSIHQQQQQYRHTGQPPPPLPYSFIPAYLPPSSAQPPTPTSLPASTPSPAPNTYFEDLVGRALGRNTTAPPPPAEAKKEREASSTTTPTISRVLSRMDIGPSESPDPLSMTGPSPTKRRKSGINGHASPVSLPTHKQTRMPFSSDAPSSLSLKHGTSQRPSIPNQWTSPVKISPRIVVEIPINRRSSVSSHMTLDDDEEEDELDWGAKDDDGDWNMGSGRASPSPARPGQMLGSRTVRTGERDSRSMYTPLSWFS